MQEQTLATIEGLQDVEKTLEVSIAQKKKELKEKTDIKTSTETLKKNNEEQEKKSDKLHNEILDQEDKLNKVTTKLKASSQTLAGLLVEIPEQKVKTTTEVDGLKQIVADKKLSLDKELSDYVLKLQKEKKVSVDELETKTAKAKTDNKTATLELSGVKSYLSEHKTEKKLLDEDVKVLKADKLKLQGDVKVLQSDKDGFDMIHGDLDIAERQVKEAKLNLEKLDSDYDKRKQAVTDEKTDMELREDWVDAKGVRLGKIASAIAKKTNDPSILRMLNDFE